jgi:glutathione S-transferase
MLTLYTAPGTCALASHIALEETGAEYELKRIDFKADQQRSAEYLAVNPKGRVPALVTPRGILTENTAILAFIAQSFPEARLAPLDDPFAFAQLQAFNSYLASTVHVAHAHGRRGSRWADEPEAIAAMQKKVPETMTAGFALIENDMFEGPWVMGESYSVADPYLYTIGLWLEGDQVDVSKLPKVMEHRARMNERPQVAKALAAQKG